MFTSVKLAVEAKRRFLASHEEPREIKIALSLGSFGSTLSPAQEFDGYYPPPFGPRAFSSDGRNTTVFDNSTDESVARNALKKFHLDRLLPFYNSPGIWELIDLIAFETVPLEREVWAVRMAMQEFLSPSKDFDNNKPWYISTVWKPGTSSVLQEGGTEDIKSVASALVSGDLPLPAGIGINCTQLVDLDAVVMHLRSSLGSSFQKPFLVLYPNGGDTYDISSRTWAGEATSDETTYAWANRLADIAKREHMSGRWSGVLVGGCCKAGPKHILALRRALSP